jgi:hypothetical protein
MYRVSVRIQNFESAPANEIVNERMSFLEYLDNYIEIDVINNQCYVNRLN